MKLFGFEFGRDQKGVSTPINPVDPSVTISTNSFSIQQSETSVKAETHKSIVEQNRELAQYIEADFAIDEIISSFADFDIDNPFELRIDNADEKLPDELIKVVNRKFKKVSTIYANGLQENIYNWYVDGSISWFIQLEEDGKGIHDIKYIEPWLIERVQPTTVQYKNNIPMYSEEEPYFIYTQSNSKNTVGITGARIKLPFDSVINIDSSGKYDKNGIPVSYIRNAMKPINDMATLTQSLVVYRLTRAPEKRVFYVDTGQLPPQKADEYVGTLKRRFKTKLDYDTKTGQVKTTNQNVIAASVDYWMPRQGGSNATEIDLLTESGNPLNTLIDELDFFRQQAYMGLKIPLSRLNDSMSVGLVKSGSITREELKFTQFISRLRRSYLQGLYQLLRIELTMSGTMTDKEWDKYSNRFLMSIASIDYFAESKKLELLTDQLTVLQTMDPYIDRFFSQEYIFKSVLNLSDDEISAMKSQIENPIIGGTTTDDLDTSGEDQSDEEPDGGLGDENAPYNNEEPPTVQPTEEPVQ